MKIEYWSDFSCPFCYIGITRMKRVLAELGIDHVEIVIKAFQLEPYRTESQRLNTVTLFMNKYRMPEKIAKEQIDKIHQAGKAEGLNIHYENPIFSSTMDAHRLVKMAQEKYSQTIANDLAEKFYKAYFTDNLDLSDKAFLSETAKSTGITDSDIQAVLTTMDYRNVVYIEQSQAQNRGINLVPHFIIDRQVELSGALSDEKIKEVLAKFIQ